MWKELGKFGMGPPSGGGGQQPGGGDPRNRGGGRQSPLGRNPLLWILVIGAILIYTQMDGSGSLFGPMDQSHVSRMAVSPDQVVGDFALVDHTGTPRTDEDFHGAYSLYYFGFTWCPDVCPSAMLVMAQVVEDLAAQNMTVQPIFVTVDPQRDTVEKLAAYVAQLPGLIGLTGSDAQVAQALQSFGITRRSQADGPDDTSYQVDHTSLFYLMGPDGAFLQHYLPTQGPTQIALEIERELTG